MADDTAVTSRTVDGTEYPAAGTYAIDPTHSELGFSVRHMTVAKVRGTFGTYEGTLELAENPVDSKISVSIDAASVNTRDANRDGHLNSADFFDTATHPKWTFVSTAIRPVSATEWKVDGDLTIKGTTKAVTLDATLEGVVQDPYGNHRVGFSASTSIEREEFGVSFDGALENGALVVCLAVVIFHLST